MSESKGNRQVSILMLTHNAPWYVFVSIMTLRRKTSYADYELVVVDNKSHILTRALVRTLKALGYIDVAVMMSYNSFFAKGNNIAAAAASKDSNLFLLLNSDIRVNNPKWLDNLVSCHQKGIGISSYGVVDDPLRVDGYCYLIDAALYKKYPLDEIHEWWWSITKQQAAVLNGGYKVVGYGEHEKYLHHYGGKSGSDFKRAGGMNVSRDEVEGWFNGKKIGVKD